MNETIVVENGQAAVATTSVSGTLSPASSATDTIAIVDTPDGKQAALKVYNLNGGGGGGASLPDQTGNAGKFLKTDGTTASWGKAVENSSEYGFGVFGGTAAADGVAIGFKTNAGAWGVAIGYKATSVNQAYVIGDEAKALGGFSVVMGRYSKAGANSIAIGSSCQMLGQSSIGLGYTGGEITEDYVFYAGRFKMLDLSDGTIPLERLKLVTDQIGDISTALTAILGE